jgi:hypothetical protein
MREGRKGKGKRKERRGDKGRGKEGEGVKGEDKFKIMFTYQEMG